MMKNKCFAILGFAFLAASCNFSDTKEILILLPGEVNGGAIVLVETSASQIFILSGNDVLVPSLVERVWWDETIVVTENHPMKSRDLFEGDTFSVPDYSATRWYVIHPGTDAVVDASSKQELNDAITSFGVDPENVSLLPLRKAQALRERQLGFRFTTSSVYSYIESLRFQGR